MVRELGSERRETVRFLSAVNVEKCDDINLVREDWLVNINGEPIVILIARLGS